MRPHNYDSLSASVSFYAIQITVQDPVLRTQATECSKAQASEAASIRIWWYIVYT